MRLGSLTAYPRGKKEKNIWLLWILCTSWLPPGVEEKGEEETEEAEEEAREGGERGEGKEEEDLGVHLLQVITYI